MSLCISVNLFICLSRWFLSKKQEKEHILLLIFAEKSRSRPHLFFTIKVTFFLSLISFLMSLWTIIWNNLNTVHAINRLYHEQKSFLILMLVISARKKTDIISMRPIFLECTPKSWVKKWRLDAFFFNLWQAISRELYKSAT